MLLLLLLLLLLLCVGALLLRLALPPRGSSSSRCDSLACAALGSDTPGGVRHWHCAASGSSHPPMPRAGRLCCASGYPSYRQGWKATPLPSSMATAQKDPSLFAVL
jgi:hypothetical protein